MSTHVLLNLLKRVGEKCLPSILNVGLHLSYFEISFLA